LTNNEIQKIDKQAYNDRKKLKKWLISVPIILLLNADTLFAIEPVEGFISQLQKIKSSVERNQNLAFPRYVEHDIEI